jgi:hypothetical protein
MNNQFNSYAIKSVFNMKTDTTGWRLVGFWGEETMNEGNRIGPLFADDDLAGCEAFRDELIRLYGLPIECHVIAEHIAQM